MTTRTVTTVTWKRHRDPIAQVVAFVLAAVVIGTMMALAVFPEALHFDGMLGPGCDPGNSRCTYREWRKGCSDEQVAARTCNLAEYRRKGGR